jgi:hypothetical protein
MTALRFLAALPFRLSAIVSGALGVALVAFSIGLTLMAEVVAE